MTPQQAKAMYRRKMGDFETITLRIYAGSGLAQTSTDYDVPARVVKFAAEPLVGQAVQGDSEIIVLHDDLVSVSFPLPIKKGPNNKAVVRGKELQIKSVDGNTRRLKGEAIAYDLVVGG